MSAETAPQERFAPDQARSKWEETTQKCLELSATSASQEVRSTVPGEGNFRKFTHQLVDPGISRVAISKSIARRRLPS